MMLPVYGPMTYGCASSDARRVQIKARTGRPTFLGVDLEKYKTATVTKHNALLLSCQIMHYKMFN